MTRSGKVINESAFTLLERSPDLTAMTGTQHRRLRTVFDRRTLQDAEVFDDPVFVPPMAGTAPSVIGSTTL
jgi:hypothetical protein